MTKKKIKLIFSNIIIIIFFIIITFSLIFTKMNYYPFINKNHYVIKVNDDEINSEELLKRYSIELLQLKKKLNLNNLDKSYNNFYKSKIYKKIISDIIYETLLKQYIHKLKISVSDADVKYYIHNQIIFKKNNVFNVDKYYSVLHNLNISTKEYVNKIKTHLKIKQFIYFITNSIFTLEKETNNFIKSLSQIRVIKIAPINILHVFKKFIITNSTKITKKNINNYNNKIAIETNRIKYSLMITKIINALHDKPNKLLKKIDLKFEKPQLFSKFHFNKLAKLIFSLPTPKKNKNAYFFIIKNNNNLSLVKFYKIIHIKFSKQQKKALLSQLFQHNLNMILNSILNDLYMKSTISYGKLNSFENIFKIN